MHDLHKFIHIILFKSKLEEKMFRIHFFTLDELVRNKFRVGIYTSGIILTECIFQLFNHTVSLQHRRSELWVVCLAVFVNLSVVSSEDVRKFTDYRL